MSWIAYDRARPRVLPPVPVQAPYAAPPRPSHRVPALGLAGPLPIHLPPTQSAAATPTAPPAPASSGGSPWWAYALGGVLGAGLVLGLAGALAPR